MNTNRFLARALVIALLLNISGITSCVMGQTGGHRDFSPKTPEAAAFEQMAEIPVGNYTGTANVSIPLYTIEYGDLKVPISLDYLGTAIHVNQEASWVGLNWILNAGGAITTQLSPSYDIGGAYPNEERRAWSYLMNRASLTKIYPNGGMYDHKIGYKVDGMHPDWCGGFGKNWFTSSFSMVEEDTLYYNNDLPRQVYNIALTHGDGESPKYHATFLGNTITFIWDRIKQEFFITGEAQGFRIIGNQGGGPTIIDGDGIKYEFNAIEIGMPEGNNIDPSLSRFDYTYYLSKIVAPTGQTIQFNYKQTGFTHPVYTVNEQIFSNGYPYEAINSFAKNHNPMIWSGVGTKSSNSIRTLSQYYTLRPMRLVSITTDNQLVKFVHGSQKRRDIRGEDYNLQKIEVYRKTNSGSEQLVKRFCFQYSYFAKNTVGGNTVEDLLGNTYRNWFGDDDFMYLRLKLEKVWEEVVEPQGTIVKKPAYEFSYYPTDLPCKASAAIDYWGYYNGKENRKDNYHTLIPRGINQKNYDGIFSFPDEYLQQVGANRLADANSMKAGMLTYIHYPTGGVTTFEYEPHSFSNYNYNSPMAEVHFSSIYVYTSNIPGYTQGNQHFKEQKEFSISSEGIYKFSCKFHQDNLQNKNYWRNIIGKPAILTRFNDGTNQPLETHVIVLTPSDTLNITGQSISKNILIKLKKGRYRLYVTPYSEHTYPHIICQTDACLSYNKNDQPDEISFGGGLRIKCITTADNGKNMRTAYNYEDEEGNTSGILMAPVIFARQKMLVYQSEKIQQIGNITVNPHTAERIRYWVASGSNMAPPASANISYSQVTVTKTGDDIDNGKTVYKYHNKRWAAGAMYDYMRRIEDPLNGKMELQTDYDNEGNVVRQIKNTYTMNCADSRLLNAVVENIYYGPSGPTGGTLTSLSEYEQALGGGCMQIYLYPSVQFSLAKCTTITYDYVGEQKIEQKEERTYNQQNHLEATVKQSTSREGESVLTEHYYPTDYTENNIAAALKNLHIINTPLETVTSYISSSGQLVTAAERVLYNNWGSPTANYQMEYTTMQRSEYSNWDRNNNLSRFERVTEITYNSVGNPRMVTEYEHDRTVYIWGYCSQYPIAVVKGASQDEVIAKLGGTSNLNAMEAALIPTMTPEVLHAKLSEIQGVLVTTYEYQPLVGMTKSIAPNGEKTTYEYDAFGRLVKVTDHHGVVIQQNSYNYKRNHQ